MIESIEGKRGMPRPASAVRRASRALRPADARAQHGNAATGCATSSRRARAWFAGHGRHGRKGLRSFSVSGRVAKPGVHLAPAGITVRELIDEYCGGMLPGHEFYGYLPGGASGGILPASLGDVPLDFDTLQPHGSFIGSAAVIVLSQRDRARDAALNLMRFFADESCGQCTPCRVGTEKAVGLIDADDLGSRRSWTSCRGRWPTRRSAGLGQAAPNPIACVVKYFPQELNDEHATHRDSISDRAAMQADARSIPAERQRCRAPPGRDDHRSGGAQRRRDSAPLLHAGHAAGRQLPRLHGGDQGRARAGAVVLSRADARAWKCRASVAARRARAEDRRRNAGGRRAGARLQARFGARAVAAHGSASASRASLRARSRRRTSRTRRWRSISTPASSARAACARAARSRSTT